MSEYELMDEESSSEDDDHQHSSDSSSSLSVIIFLYLTCLLLCFYCRIPITGRARHSESDRQLDGRCPWRAFLWRPLFWRRCWWSQRQHQWPTRVNVLALPQVPGPHSSPSKILLQLQSGKNYLNWCPSALLIVEKQKNRGGNAVCRRDPAGGGRRRRQQLSPRRWQIQQVARVHRRRRRRLCWPTTCVPSATRGLETERSFTAADLTSSTASPAPSESQRSAAPSAPSADSPFSPTSSSSSANGRPFFSFVTLVRNKIYNNRQKE